MNQPLATLDSATLERLERITRLLESDMARLSEAAEALAAAGQRFMRLVETPEAVGWIRLCELLMQAANDPAVAKSKPASEFLAVVVELAKDALTASSGVDALMPLDGLLPMGEKGKKFTPKGRGEGAVKKLVREVLGPLEKRLRRKAEALEVWQACAARRRSGIKFVNDPTWGTPVQAVPKNGDPPAKWSRFRVIVSEVRKDAGK